jgi:choline dehydrogenase
MSVVDAKLKLYAIENPRIADGSVKPRVISGNMMVPCVIIDEAPQRLWGVHTIC